MSKVKLLVLDKSQQYVLSLPKDITKEEHKALMREWNRALKYRLPLIIAGDIEIVEIGKKNDK